MIGKLWTWSRRPKARKFNVLLHADHLWLEPANPELKGKTAVGGVYAWRVVAAANEETAIALARQEFEKELRGSAKVLNAPADPLGISVDECAELKPSSKWRGSALVFYIDTDEQADA